VIKTAILILNIKKERSGADKAAQGTEGVVHRLRLKNTTSSKKCIQSAALHGLV